MAMTPESKGAKILALESPWNTNSNRVWLASTLTLNRNVEKFLFPAKLGPDRRHQLISLLGNELTPYSGLNNGMLIHADEVGPQEKEYLSEHFLLTSNIQAAHSGEAFVIDDSGQFLALINISNHLQLHLLDSSGEIEKDWNQLIAIENFLGQNIKFAYSPKWGFLTADPFTCGTALQVSLYLHLPALLNTQKIEEVRAKYVEESLLLTGLQGSSGPANIIGDILVVQNNYTLGVTEENIIAALRTVSIKLEVEENSALSHMREEPSSEIKDKISRSYAILIHSYQIEAVEALNAVSLLKLGSYLGWVKGITAEELNALFFNCRRAHLLSHCPQKVELAEIPHSRSEYIHNMLKNVELTI